MTGGISVSPRALALVPVGAYAVHQLRYVLAFGPDAGRELTADGNGYLGPVMPWALLVAAGALVAAFVRLTRAWEGRPGAAAARRWPAARLWAALALLFVLLFAGQELLEGLLGATGPDGLARIAGDGGWWAVPASALVAGLVVLALRGEDALVAAIVRRRGVPRGDGVTPRTQVAEAPALPPTRPLATARAGRAPPRAAVA